MPPADPLPRKAFALRLDPALHSALERCAAAELRSVNAQIEMLLREALERRGVSVGDPAPRRRGRPPIAD
ncbi:MAG: toxin-antitoxin system HicB family antitoxin [Sphingobium sp.]|uniref:toxin-antitoxin system HicB family antitoxin n=1 Tax=Sphingobium sp. TaxID=1912891 RepID=UPI000DB24BED|nr:toxin-antitoxin system HicB family antitoxin [Sphingobium sp.]PZU13601.1 MAG: toxin-antitoxin system HicB family antitoxin [Sphingobium sp.]